MKKNQNGYIEIFLAFLVAIVILLIIFSIDNKSFKGEKYEAIAAKVIEKKYSEATVTNTIFLIGKSIMILPQPVSEKFYIKIEVNNKLYEKEIDKDFSNCVKEGDSIKVYISEKSHIKLEKFCEIIKD